MFLGNNIKIHKLLNIHFKLAWDYQFRAPLPPVQICKTRLLMLGLVSQLNDLMTCGGDVGLLHQAVEHAQLEWISFHYCCLSFFGRGLQIYTFSYSGHLHSRLLILPTLRLGKRFADGRDEESTARINVQSVYITE
uniref:Uncharacterized protein n=1 Tax=Lactuca sativa TaxID=4236 RepID=A0A9R1W7D0_LACSA|nr:hypothetical protein LSAT_V11C300102450 [Lactuca sativa]